jgi:hypothetical protein
MCSPANTFNKGGEKMKTASGMIGDKGDNIICVEEGATVFDALTADERKKGRGDSGDA